jgi:hypothetical protein
MRGQCLPETGRGDFSGTGIKQSHKMMGQGQEAALPFLLPEF